MSETPFSRGYAMPAEWQRHESTWLAWPKDPTTFPPGLIEKVEQTFARMISELSKGERVDLLVDNEEMQSHALEMIGEKNVRFHTIITADVWMRDYCPIFIRGKDLAATKWIFNAWGNKYDDLKKDNETGMEIARSTGLEIFEPGIVLEGGSIDINGLGTCLTTRECLLNKNRNPSLDQDSIENYLKEYLGITNLIWLNKGVSGDDTDGHVDDIARFVNENTIVCMSEESKEDENYEALEENYNILQKSKDQNGNQLKIVKIQMPGPVSSPDGRLPASYANFYIGNSCVIVPTFNDPNDRPALETLQKLFPDRRVVGIDSRALVYGFGAIHCTTQQMPFHSESV
jgi:agmatine deiminase